MKMNKYNIYQRALEKRGEQKEYQKLRCLSTLEENERADQLNFASNDFLGLSQHPHIKKSTIKYVLQWGAGTLSSRLPLGHLECHRSVEERLADLLGKEEALLFPSANQVHQQVISTLISHRSMIFIDRFCHHGLIQAATLSTGQIFRYEHQNYRQLESLLEKAPKDTQKWILTESLFGIDGEMADLKKISDIAKTYGALLYVDDSHAVGMYGKHGMGLASFRKGIDIVFGSFGKESGTFGAYLATSSLFKEYLLSFNPQLIETTTLPPAILGAISGALDLIPDMQAEREKVRALSSRLRKNLEENFFDIGGSTSHLIPLICRKEESQSLAENFLKEGILVTFLRPPLIPEGASRLRFTVNALHTEDAIDQVAKQLAEPFL